MYRENIKSDNIKTAGFSDNILEIEFKQGTIYQYSPVTLDEYTSFLISESKGKWVNEFLKKNKNITYKKI